MDEISVNSTQFETQSLQLTKGDLMKLVVLRFIASIVPGIIIIVKERYHLHYRRLNVSDGCVFDEVGVQEHEVWKPSFIGHSPFEAERFFSS